MSNRKIIILSVSLSLICLCCYCSFFTLYFGSKDSNNSRPDNVINSSEENFIQTTSNSFEELDKTQLATTIVPTELLAQTAIPFNTPTPTLISTTTSTSVPTIEFTPSPTPIQFDLAVI